MASRKKNTENIDEDMLLSSIGKSRTINDVPSTPVGNEKTATNDVSEESQAQTSEETQVQILKEERAKPAEKKAQNRVQQPKPQTVNPAETYRDTYLCKNEIRARHSVYISEEEFAYYADVVRVITHNDISVGAYVDNVLRKHRKMHDEELNDLYLQEHERMMASRSKK